MGEYTAFRSRILAILAAGGMAQACGGTVADDTVGGGGGTAEPPKEMEESETEEDSITTDPGCLPVTTIDERLTLAEQACGSPYCTRSDETLCLSEVQIPSNLKGCAAPHVAGMCPAAGDIWASCNVVVVGEASRLEDRCCYPATRLSCAVPGRALRASGEAILPDVIVGAAVEDANPELGADARAALAALWCEGARFEYASVASFARSTFQLMALGAPVELVRASQEASLDEIEHARLCFALASRFRGRQLGPGKLPAAWESEPVDLGEFAEENVIGGCIGETVAALMAAEQLGRATDPQVRAALETIAADEMRHAELAWRIAAWTARVGGPGVRGRMAAAFRTALGELEGDRESPVDDSDALEGLGQLSEARERAIRRRVLGEVVLPGASAIAA